ncbi:GNAT family N-acetyltransferase [Granulicella sp. WH15]|uniref:GNAT family N-acetyltransferase n=1 Tax=Granulicella sp. WH15 TaxID=2602070 RepID=UPI0021054DAD|nr:GNAT family N-acetyltransferase [Granulicella sp. WH15]
MRSLHGIALGAQLEDVVGNVNYFLRTRDNFVISTDPDLLDADAVFGFLEQAQWWSGLTPESLDRALGNSLCFSLLEGDRQIGLARVITDYVTYAYLCDVYIVEERRRRGLGSWLIRSVLEHPDLKPLKRVALITHDAQPFYLGLDFQFTPHPDSYMERLQ